MARLSLHLLGSFAGTLDGDPLVGFDSDKVRALLAYLAVEPGRPHRREKLAGLLWPDFAERSARTNLRRALANLRQVIGDPKAEIPFLRVDRSSVQLNPESEFELDVTEFRSLVKESEGPPSASSSLQQAIALYQGDFMEGFSVPDSPPFEEWILINRESMRQQLLEVLHKQACMLEKQGSYTEAKELVSRQLTVDPYYEAAHRQMMQLLALEGRRTQALLHYQELSALLREDLRVSPSKETQRLIRKLRTDEEVSEQVFDRKVKPKHNLPAQVTTFIGRSRELDEVIQLLKGRRQLTLTGPPGTGKTRLALETASSIVEQFDDGVTYVNLAPIDDPALAAGTIALVLGIRGTDDISMALAVENFLRQRQLLLLLDNFEHVVEAAPLVSQLLATSPELRILVTSREPLHIYGEHEYIVPPLPVPDLEQASSLAHVSDNDAVRLFVQRAQAVNSDFALDAHNAAAIANICVRLDGLPLAIELAAARSKLLTPEMIRSRLTSRLATLTGGSRYLPARLQTLRAAIDWSYDLLDQAEKTLFGRLAVFQGGRSIEAIAAICDDGLDCDFMDCLESLLNRSLLQRVSGPHGEPRFVMLETIHEYARERLLEAGDGELVRRRHAVYFAELTERAEIELCGQHFAHWCSCLETELDNIRSALTWSLRNGEPVIALRIVSALRDFWYNTGHIAEGSRWAERALEVAAGTPLVPHVRALNVAGMLATIRGEYKRGERLHTEALALAIREEDKLNQAWALVFLGFARGGSRNKYDEGIANCEQALVLFRELDDRRGAIHALTVIGELSRLSGDYDQAGEVYEECLTICRASGHRLRELVTLGNLGFVATHRGDYDRAETMQASILPELLELGQRYHLAAALALLVGPVAAKGEPERAARYLGMADTVLANMGAALQVADQFEVDRYISAVREQLGAATFERERAVGQNMSPEEVARIVHEIAQTRIASQVG